MNNRLVKQLHKYLQESNIPEWLTKGKSTLIQKEPRKRNHPNQLQANNKFTNDVENSNCTNKGGNSPFAQKQRTIS